ncbi:hypothetical protein FX983_01916 [Pseudomonas frederiksbergensis]|uniref:Uncharacterized protein n=1 Tax=Pseudomonas frederiksbergensis TaxID=104087 RepID=A0A6L5BYT7_9PSED|nr:hypothetical protein FX983_01916 [Pseudomonas frederiksbergensis]
MSQLRLFVIEGLSKNEDLNMSASSYDVLVLC